jgi:hypothetical protein
MLRRLRFSITDLLLFTALAFAGLCMLTPIFRESFGRPTPCLHKISPGAAIACSLFIVALTLAGFLVGLYRANGRERSMLKRIGVIIFGTVLVWIISLPFFIQIIQYRSCTITYSMVAYSNCKQYAEAQEIYHRTDYDGDGVLEYAQSFKGNNSLFERKAGAADILLIDQVLAASEDLPGEPRRPGYVLKILKAQGSAAPGGAKSYLVPNSSGGSDMTRGYAMIAQPAEYDVTGCDCFMISNSGTIYQADLGEHTAERVAKITEFNPDPKDGWQPTE